ncbi:MAG: response regulator [Nitrospiria bacterium]
MPRILLIEDEEEVREVVKHHLTNANYEVVEAENGEEAIQKIKEGSNPVEVDAAICDVRMPKINGIEAVSYFQEEFPHLPVIIMTGYPETDMAIDLLKKGVKEYLVKPVEKDVLLEAVEKAVTERTWPA